MNIGLFTKLKNHQILLLLATRHKMSFNQSSIPTQVYMDYINKLCNKVRKSIRKIKLRYSIFPIIIGLINICFVWILAFFDYVNDVNTYEILYSTSAWYSTNMVFTIIKYIIISLIVSFIVYIITYNYYSRFIILSLILFIIFVALIPSFSLKIILCIFIFILLIIFSILLANKLSAKRREKYLLLNNMDLSSEYQEYNNLLNTYAKQEGQQ